MQNGEIRSGIARTTRQPLPSRLQTYRAAPLLCLRKSEARQILPVRESARRVRPTPLHAVRPVLLAHPPQQQGSPGVPPLHEEAEEEALRRAGPVRGALFGSTA